MAEGPYEPNFEYETVLRPDHPPFTATVLPKVTGEVRTVNESTGGDVRWRAERPDHKLNPMETAWVAGLIEGEGSYYLRSGPYPAVIFQLNMTDEDVVRRAHAYMGFVGTVNPHAPGPRSVKQQWRWRVCAQAEVAWLMDEMYPYMGQRRRAKIEELRSSLPAWTEQ